MTKHSQGAQKRILRLIVENSLVTIRELRDAVGCSSLSTVNYHIAELTDKGFLLRQVKQRRGFTVTQKGYEYIGAKVIVCKCCGHPSLKLLDRN